MPQAVQARKNLTPWVAAVICFLVLAGAGVIVFRQSRTMARQAELLSQRAGENAQLRSRLRELTTAASSPPASVSVPTPHRIPPNATEATAEVLAAAEQRAARLRESLAQSNAQVTRLESDISDLRSRMDSATDENRRLSASVESGNKSLADANQALESVRSDLKTYTDRVSQLETANANGRQDAAAAKREAAQLNQTISEMEGIFHRRDMYLSDILLRYREITDQYRSISGVMDSRRDRQSAPVSSPEISRIQNAIALADEDLKQIHALTVQAQRLEKKLK